MSLTGIVSPSGIGTLGGRWVLVREVSMASTTASGAWMWDRWPTSLRMVRWLPGRARWVARPWATGRVESVSPKMRWVDTGAGFTGDDLVDVVHNLVALPAQ